MEDRLWTSGRDEEGPYIKRGDQWVGYEDPLAVKIKVAYVRSAGLGGVSLTSIDLDDFQVIIILSNGTNKHYCAIYLTYPFFRAFVGILGRC